VDIENFITPIKKNIQLEQEKLFFKRIIKIQEVFYGIPLVVQMTRRESVVNNDRQ